MTLPAASVTVVWASDWLGVPAPVDGEIRQLSDAV